VSELADRDVAARQFAALTTAYRLLLASSAATPPPTSPPAASEPRPVPRWAPSVRAGPPPPIVPGPVTIVPAVPTSRERP
jgi:hypothetical protein